MDKKEFLDKLSGLILDICKITEDNDFKCMGIQTLPLFGGPGIFLDHRNWDSLSEGYREYIEPHSAKDRDPRTPLVERMYKLWFTFRGVEIYCLMSYEELLASGREVPKYGPDDCN